MDLGGYDAVRSALHAVAQLNQLKPQLIWGSCAGVPTAPRNWLDLVF
jgi:hypothetical protein